MLWLQFGARTHAPTKRSPQRVVGDFALHLQCPWRVSASDAVVVASGDMFHPAADRDEREFDPGRPGDAVADTELRRWIDAHANAPLEVMSVDVDCVGGFALELARSNVVEVFPDVSAAVRPGVELWRLLRPGRDLAHVVLLSSGIEASEPS